MADQDAVRQRIIASVFSRQGTNGASEDTYVGHIKIREDDGSGMKARYILLSRTLLLFVPRQSAHALHQRLVQVQVLFTSLS